METGLVHVGVAAHTRVSMLSFMVPSPPLLEHTGISSVLQD